MSERRRRLGVIGQIGGGGVALTGALGFVREVIANEVSTLGQWVISGVVIFGLLLWIVSWFFKQRPADDAPAAVGTEIVVPPMPHAGELVGRDADVHQVVMLARAEGLVLVYGPDGIGAGSVAISAAEVLVPDPARRRYVDLHALKPDEAHSARIQVLRTLGVAPSFFEGHSASQCADLAAHALVAGDADTVLVVDNVTGARQVDWLRAVKGGYVIIAGDLPAELVQAGTAAVAVQGLGVADAFTLLCRQDSNEIPRRRSWWRGLLEPRRHVGGENSIAERIDAEPALARELAEVYLKHPRVVIALGRWLARNRHVGFEELLDDLHRDTENFELQVILRKQLDGASQGARRLLALLAKAPEAEYTDRAIAAMSRLPLDRTSGYLGELTARFIVEQTSSRYRLADRAAQLAEDLRPRAVDAAAVRLAAYFADLATAQADELTGPRATAAQTDDRTGDWFKAEDATLRRVLGQAGQPRRTGPHLWRIADALELWFAREQRLSYREQVAVAMLDRATEFDDRAAIAVAHLRLSAIHRTLGGSESLKEAETHLDRAAGYDQRRRVPWLPQLYTERALVSLAKDDLDGAREAVRQCREVRPYRDTRGKLIDLLNFAAIEIRAGNFKPAYRHLLQALDLAETLDDRGGQAHARELRGIVHWEQQNHAEAKRDWEQADLLYREVDDADGRARCARHQSV